MQDGCPPADWSDQKLPMRSVCGSRITVLGTGDIGTSFARRVKAMGAKTVVGVSRSGRHVDDAYDADATPRQQLDQVLPETEILAMALPGHGGRPEGILSPRAASPCCPGRRWVVNGGPWHRHRSGRPEWRPMNAGRLAGAALDVVRPEPLPPGIPVEHQKPPVDASSLRLHVAGHHTGYGGGSLLRGFRELHRRPAPEAAGGPPQRAIDNGIYKYI
ncbi:MAG: NAD(P)-dependent oxidoreductase [Lachnospiraceae bacterium]